MKKVAMAIAFLGLAFPFGAAFCADDEQDVSSTASEGQKSEPQSDQPLSEEQSDESSK
ncbi:MAG: hypothetical protein LBT63_00215 [Holosporaceae bacterium]|nr:hypothetical protein [Holosporaceae bacterium]